MLFMFWFSEEQGGRSLRLKLACVKAIVQAQSLHTPAGIDYA